MSTYTVRIKRTGHLVTVVEAASAKQAISLHIADELAFNLRLRPVSVYRAPVASKASLYTASIED
jgi:hypothetical protein